MAVQPKDLNERFYPPCPAAKAARQTSGTQLDGIAGFHRNIRAPKQHIRIQSRAFTLVRDDDLLGFILADIICRRHRLRQRQTRHPWHLLILHRPDDRDPMELCIELSLQDHVLPGQKRHLRRRGP